MQIMPGKPKSMSTGILERNTVAPTWILQFVLRLPEGQLHGPHSSPSNDLHESNPGMLSANSEVPSPVGRNVNLRRGADGKFEGYR